MDASDSALLRSLVAVAWADGKVAEEEMSIIESLIESFGASQAEAAELRSFAQQRRTLEDVPLNELDNGSRRRLLQLAVLVAYADGEFGGQERLLLDELANRLDIPPDERAGLVKDSAIRAKGLFRMLQS